YNFAGPGDISIGDPQNYMSDHWYNMVYAECPGVVYLRRSGTAQSGRTPVSYDTSAPFYWSDPNPAHWSGVTQQDYIPDYFAQADYFINFPILKSHNSGGITVGGKNHYGSLMRSPTASGYYNMHHTRPANSDGSPYSTPGMGNYRANVDLMGHPKLGGKTMLVLVDFLYAGRSWDSHPIRWNMAPFNGNWPSSILLSQDQVAADSVAFDFMDYEWNASPPNNSNMNGYPQYPGTDDYLHEAALIPNPPSGANYDPNNDGGLTESLGVHEHWNNAIDKQYSRNLDPVNGTGIELTTSVPGWPDLNGDWCVDFEDFGKFANAWGSTPSDPHWDPNCDISEPYGIIDESDLLVLVQNWLIKLTADLVVPGAVIQEVYSEAGTSFEGPMWDPQSQKLYFSRRTSPYKTYRLDSPGVVTAWRDPAPQTNGMFLSLDGRLMACDESTMQITSHRIDPTGPADSIVLADSSGGFTKMPNDLCQLANGNIYFTTPTWDGSPASAQGVWLLEPNGVVTRVNNALRQPNGIMASLDGTKLYVSSGSTVAAYKQCWVFDIYPDGTLSSETLFFVPSNPPNPSNVLDGMTIDELGNLYFSGLGGIWIVSPQGQQLGFISLPQAVYNVTFGGPKGKTLYMTCNNKVYSLAMTVRGGEYTKW
ncbi:MAG: SMP-30/gluconolactonase/LRE family protein, partial [Phycisphaerae bacterium]